MTMLLTQIGNELLKMIARRRTHIGFGAFVAAQVIILLLLRLPKPRARFEKIAMGFGLLADEYLLGLTYALAIIAFTFALLGSLYIALVAGDIVSKEVEDGTMRMILSRPISRMRLMGIKWIACLIYTLTLVGFLGVSALMVTTIYASGLGKLLVFVKPEDVVAFYNSGEGLFRYACAIAALAYSALAIASIAFMFGCFRMKPATATIVTLSVLFIDFVMRNIPFFEPIQHWFISYHTASWVRVFAREPAWGDLLISWAYLAAINIACFTIGSIRFCRRDFKS